MLFVCLKSLIFPLPEKPSILWLHIGSFWTSKDVKDIQNNFRFTFCLMSTKVAKKMWQKRCKKKGSSDSQVTISKHILPYFFHLSKLKITQPTMDFVTRRSIEHPCFNLDFLFPLLLSKYRVNFIGTHT